MRPSRREERWCGRFHPGIELHRVDPSDRRSGIRPPEPRDGIESILFRSISATGGADPGRADPIQGEGDNGRRLRSWKLSALLQARNHGPLLLKTALLSLKLAIMAFIHGC